MSRRNLQKAFGRLDAIKKTRDPEVPGILGFTINGVNTAEVGNRSGFVWVRLRNNTNEVIQAFNDQVSPVYGLPVIVIRDENDRVRYKIKGKDLGVYQNWNNTPYLPRHGNQHSFNPSGGGGGDVTFIYSQQFMPLAVHPSGSAGGGNVYVQPYAYYQGSTWKYAGGTGTASLLGYKPTGTSARMVLVYLDANGNPQLSPGDTYFAASITGNAAVLPYVPLLGSPTDIPLGAVRLVSGTNNLVWDNIYDLRPIIVSDGFIPTGTTAGHEIQFNGTPLAQRDALNFVGNNFNVYDQGGVTNVSGSFSAGGGGGGSNVIAIQDGGVFQVSGTAISFDANLSVSVVGTVAHIDASTSGGSGTSGYTEGARIYRTTDTDTLPVSTGTVLDFDAELWDTDSIHSGSSSQLYCNTAGVYLIHGQAQFARNSTAGWRMLHILLNGTTYIARARHTVSGLIDNPVEVSTIWQLDQGDYVELWATSNVALAISSTGSYSPHFMMQRIG